MVKNKKKKYKLKKYFVKFFKKIKSKNKNVFSAREVTVIMLFSLGLGFLMCFGCINLLTGKNYISVSRDLDKVVDTYYAIVDNYYGDVDKKLLIDGAIDGMVSSVGDAYTVYTDIDDTNSFDETINGSYEGIGCSVVTLVDGSIIISDVFEGYPAYNAGLLVGDIVVKVDGESYEGKTGSALSSYIKNSGKSEVVITVLREDKEIDIIINLGKVEIPYIFGEVITKNDKKIGYINISLFSSTSYEQFKDKLEKLEKEGIDSLVIDVRNNNGGYLTSVTDICNMFLKKGDIIYQLEDSSGTKKKKDSSKEKREYDVAVIINEGSASASEILASAFKESYNGYVVGVNSHGKGSVQQTKKLLDGSMIKFTTQKWHTPLGNSIEGVGVEPTNVVEMSEEYYNNPSMETDNQLQEALNLVSK